MSVGARYYGGETGENTVVSECMRLRWMGAGGEAVGETRCGENACDYGVRWSPAGRFYVWTVPGPSRRGGTLPPHWDLTGVSSVSVHSARRALVPMARLKRTLGAWHPLVPLVAAPGTDLIGVELIGVERSGAVLSISILPVPCARACVVRPSSRAFPLRHRMRNPGVSQCMRLRR